jgi:hypothetical protein
MESIQAFNLFVSTILFLLYSIHFMQIAAVLNGHLPDLILDTLDSISLFMTDKVLVIIDAESYWRFESVDLLAHKIEGFRHGANRAPYRNVALGLMTAAEKWPDVDWYCYCEHDVLFGSERFKHNLSMAAEKNIWMLGSDGHVDDVQMPLVESLIGEKLTNGYYLIGCCQFFSRAFIDTLKKINFFERFLTMTNGFSRGYLPGYSGYDISEHMYPTLARHFGGNIGVFATWYQDEWHGPYQYYPVRWKPELDPDKENFPEASILHPLKKFDNPIREYHRNKRKNLWKKQLESS